MKAVTSTCTCNKCSKTTAFQPMHLLRIAPVGECKGAGYFRLIGSRGSGATLISAFRHEPKVGKVGSRF